MNKLRLSYSLLSYWERGDIQGATDCYLHKETPGTPAMEYGKKVHKEIEEHIKAHGKFPEWFFNYELKNPQTEQKVTAEYNEMFDLSGVFDCVDIPTLFEFKTGSADSLEWARTWQLPIYFLIAELNKIDIEKAILIRHNKESDFVIVHNSKRLRDKAENVIQSLGPEMYEYFFQQGLI